MKGSTQVQRILLCSLCLVARSLAFVPQNPVRLVALPQPRSFQSRSILPWSPSRRKNVCPPLQVSYDDLMEKLPSQAVIDAAESAKDGKVIASDVAASAGVSISQARKDLTALATLSRGDIAVSKDGELIYSFPNNLKGVLASNSAKFKAMQSLREVWPIAFYVVRVGFGVALLASLVAIFTTIFFISQSGSSSDDDRRRDNRGGGFGGGGMMRMGGMWGPSPLDFFFYRPYGYYGVRGADRSDPEEMGFFESVFSYIFGDGNPNAELEEKRLGLVANMIRKNKGAVTAEQLAPFCDDAPKPSDMETSTYADESFVLPLVAQLNGEPQVTEDGEIVYVFSELLTSASSAKVVPAASRDSMILRRAGLSGDASAGEIKQFLTYNRIETRGTLERRDLVRLLESKLPPISAREEFELLDSDPAVLQEQEYQFSLAPQTNKFLAGGLGAVNLGGALYLGNILGQYASYGIRLPSYFGVVQSLYPFLLSYAILFNVIPVVRNFWIQKKNGEIRERNKSRRSWQTALASAAGNSRIGSKLAAAAKMGTKVKRVGGSNDIIFDTSQPIEDIEKKKQQLAMEDFDKLLDSDDNVFM